MTIIVEDYEEEHVAYKILNFQKDFKFSRNRKFSFEMLYYICPERLFALTKLIKIRSDRQANFVESNLKQFLLHRLVISVTA